MIPEELSAQHIRPDPLRPTTWELIEIGALLICSGWALWWAVSAAWGALR